MHNRFRCSETIFRSQASNVSNANPVRFDCFSPLKGDSNQGIGHEDVHWPTRPKRSCQLAGVLDLARGSRAKPLGPRPPLGISDKVGRSGTFPVGSSSEKPAHLHTKHIAMESRWSESGLRRGGCPHQSSGDDRTSTMGSAGPQKRRH